MARLTLLLVAAIVLAVGQADDEDPSLPWNFWDILSLFNPYARTARNLFQSEKREALRRLLRQVLPSELISPDHIDAVGSSNDGANLPSETVAYLPSESTSPIRFDDTSSGLDLAFNVACKLGSFSYHAACKLLGVLLLCMPLLAGLIMAVLNWYADHKAAAAAFPTCRAQIVHNMGVLSGWAVLELIGFYIVSLCFSLLWIFEAMYSFDDSTPRSSRAPRSSPFLTDTKTLLLWFPVLLGAEVLPARVFHLNTKPFFTTSAIATSFLVVGCWFCKWCWRTHRYRIAFQERLIELAFAFAANLTCNLTMMDLTHPSQIVMVLVATALGYGAGMPVLRHLYLTNAS